MELTQQQYLHSGAMVVSAIILGGALCYSANQIARSQTHSPSAAPTSEKTEMRLVFPERVNLTVAGVINGTYELEPKGTFTLAGPPALNILGHREYTAIPLRTDTTKQGNPQNVQTLKVELSNGGPGVVPLPFEIRGR